MFIKQIDMKTAFELASRGMEIKTMVPIGPGTGWMGMEPDTLQNMLSDVLFFRPEPAMEVPMVKEEMEGPAPSKEEGEAGGTAFNRTPALWVPVPNGKRRYGEVSGILEGQVGYEEDRGRAGEQRRQHVQLPEEDGGRSQ